MIDNWYSYNITNDKEAVTYGNIEWIWGSLGGIASLITILGLITKQ